MKRTADEEELYALFEDLFAEKFSLVNWEIEEKK